MQKIAVTGCAGFYGRQVVRALKARFPQARILGIDVVPSSQDELDEFLQLDILDEGLHTALAEFQPDTILHLAFVVNPIRDLKRMHEVNVTGTENLLAAARQVQPQRLFVASSATAYGAWSDNPVPVDEDHPLRARPEYQYSTDKVKIESMLQAFAGEQPEIAVSWARPSIIYGEGVDNYLTKFILLGPIIVLPGGSDTEMQFVHLEDVADATIAILESGARGPFNIAPDDWVTLSELAKMSNRRTFSVPFAMCKAFTTVWWGLRLPLFHFPSGLWYFIRFPWVVSPKRLIEETGYEFRYTSRETLQQLLDSRRDS